MSLVGIDVGSSSVKASAYSEAGELLGVARQDVTPEHPQPGWWQQAPEEVWQATLTCLGRLAQAAEVRRDPPKVMAVSASGREIFPVDGAGRALGPCLMGADIRGAEFEIVPEGAAVPETWTLSCGHLRERMDPVFRLMWWRTHHPDVVAQARWFLGWHEFLTLRLCGRPVTERSLAGRWLIYDVRSADWSPERMRDWNIDPAILPELGAWGSLIEQIRPEVAEGLGLEHDVQVAVGGHDINCCALGAAVLDVGTACLVSGSYENILVPTNLLPTATMLARGLSITPHPPRREGLSVYAISPTGAAVMNWARSLLDVSIEEQDAQLGTTSLEPGSVIAVPFLSGSMLYWEDGRKASGALLGLTLATSRADILKAFMESIACDHVNTLSLFAEEGIAVRYFRATGGGSRSAWWTQLKADLMGVPIEVSSQPEPGTFGAALLAGLAVGVYDDLGQVSLRYGGTSQVFDPNPSRAALYQERIEQYRKTVATLLTHLT
jgi:xylulokinase